MPDDTGWHSIRVTYYDPGADALLLHGVRPFRDRLGAPVAFTRGWLRGPHVRLDLRVTAPVFAERALPLARQVIGGYLARCPSRFPLDPHDRLPAHRRLAELECEPGPLLPWEPDNTIRAVEFDRRGHVFADPGAAAFLAAAGAAATGLTLGMIARTAGPARLALAFDLLTGTAGAFSAGGLTSGFVAFRSHAEAFLSWFPEAGELRPAWQRHYARHAPALVRRVRTAATAPFVREWCDTLRPFLTREIGLRPPADPSAGAPVDVAASAFHRTLLANPRWHDVERSAQFRRYRQALNLTYLGLSRLGIDPAQRFLLCHLAANAVEEAYGVSAAALVDAGPLDRGRAG